MHYAIKWNLIEMYHKNSNAHISRYFNDGTIIQIYFSVREYNQNSLQRRHVYVLLK